MREKWAQGNLGRAVFSVVSFAALAVAAVPAI
jgi:hypothetical protein